MNESNVKIAVLSLYFVNDYLEYHTLHLFFQFSFLTFSWDNYVTIYVCYVSYSLLLICRLSSV